MSVFPEPEDLEGLKAMSDDVRVILDTIMKAVSPFESKPTATLLALDSAFEEIIRRTVDRLEMAGDVKTAENTLAFHILSQITTLSGLLHLLERYPESRKRIQRLLKMLASGELYREVEGFRKALRNESRPAD